MLIVVLYIGIAAFFNIYILLVMQHGSATLMWVASTLSVPLANFAFMIGFFVGTEFETKFSWFNLGALVLVVVGLVIFNKCTRPEDTHPADVDPVKQQISEMHHL